MPFGRELVVLLTNLPCLVSFWCMFRGRVEVWTKYILYQFIEGQTHFSTYWVCRKRVCHSMNRCRMFFVQTSTRPLNMHQKLTKHGRFCMQNNQLPTKSCDEFEDNSIMCDIMHERWYLWVFCVNRCEKGRTIPNSWLACTVQDLFGSGRRFTLFACVHTTKNYPSRHQG